MIFSQGSPKPGVSWTKIIESERQVTPEPPAEDPAVEDTPAAEGEAPATETTEATEPAAPAEPAPTPEPVFETVQEEVEMPEYAIISNGKDHSTIVIRKAERDDTAIYRMSIKVVYSRICCNNG